ncbi:ATP-binding protein [Nitratireductor indicus]|uniref:ATP-binding protein n=1 Tax=Nitratireductor indicus TaxID=721133 RepID=UPI0028757CB5|nr:ATP-binding protein [Nitratireductor indicus]MDS1135984.1 ATP-binding protein [Nitratireductor indicus]
MALINSVNIRPGVNVLSVLPHLNYKAWFALAEFVDNAIQSSIDRQRELRATKGNDYKLRVDIDFNPAESMITVTDNAAGIASSDYQRAFRPAEIPPDASGLSEFGMGMKSAACWFAPSWSVRSSALGERTQRTVFFDIDKIVHDSIEELNVVSTDVAEDAHGTEIRLERIRKFPRGRTIPKIKEHLASIYRVFIREGLLELYVDGERLDHEDPAILNAPSYRDPDGPPIQWRKEINIGLGDGKSATGFVAIREIASTRLAGFALFRRKRLIMGSADEAYRPEDIFGRPNTYPYQRIFGEIHLKGFFVSHTKDGVKWEESEEAFLRKLRQELSGDALPLIQQAREHRTRSGAKAVRKEAAEALQATASSLSETTLRAGREETCPSAGELAPPNGGVEQDDLPELASGDREEAEISLRFRNEPWVVRLELSYAEDDADWLTIRNRPSITDPEPREILVRIAMLHPFMSQFPTLDSEGFSAVLKIAAAMALAEVAATELADRHPSAVRRFTNEILKTQMSKRLING